MFSEKLAQFKSLQKSFLSDPMNFVSVGFGLLINIIHWVVLLIKIQPSSQNILLHYNVIYGPDFVEKSSYIYVIPATALILFILNLVLSNIFFRREKIAAYFLNFASIAVQIVFLVASLVLIFINE